MSPANLRLATVSLLSLFDQKINPLVTPALKTLVFIMKLLLAFVLAGFLLLCVTYSTLAYYQLVWIAKGFKPYGSIRSRKFFQPKAEC